MNDTSLPCLPLELKYEIISYMDKDTLVAAARTCFALSQEAERYLYQDVKLSNKQIEKFFKSLSRCNSRASLVRKCTIVGFGQDDRRFINQVLVALHNLRSLAIIPPPLEEAPGNDMVFSWSSLLDGCEFKLVEFITSLECDLSMVEFLHRQSQIQKYIHSGYTITDTHSALHPLTLPSLTHFYGNIMDIDMIVPHRPVTHVTVDETVATIGLPLFILQPLAASKGPVKYLSLSLCDMATASVLSLIYPYTPHLIGLSLSYPRDVFSLEAELDWADALAKFRNLKYLEIEVSLDSSGESKDIPFDCQKELVHTWHDACPSLQSVSFGSQLQEETEFGLEMNVGAMISSWEKEKGNWVRMDMRRDDLCWRW
ncbi:uncharacterized protein EI90DRAFT_1565255 [Cantharellus anzutake]|uniref:uncharacterized protein n=1 Tax=Cantharellus anzutake TaxID=1750568 RepID=UPI001902D135|nr:uncharacterized protein EI90DRAFT_1565255 [Cantharellus anzutake]KAF8328350.1 hypothetical protein EI90DRAFT_1565255 [Cantharellus anzutake]